MNSFWIELDGFFVKQKLILYNSNISNFCKQKILQILEYCFPNNYFGRFLFFQISKIYSLQNVFHSYRQLANCWYSNN